MGTKNKMDDLRNHLFETLEALKDRDNPMDLARAKTVAVVARVLVETAKVEVEFLKVTGEARSSGFMPLPERAVPPAAPLRSLPGRS